MLSVIKKKFLIRKEIIFIIIDYYVGISFVNIKWKIKIKYELYIYIL